MNESKEEGAGDKDNKTSALALGQEPHLRVDNNSPLLSTTRPYPLPPAQCPLVQARNTSRPFYPVEARDAQSSCQNSSLWQKRTTGDFQTTKASLHLACQPPTAKIALSRADDEYLPSLNLSTHEEAPTAVNNSPLLTFCSRPLLFSPPPSESSAKEAITRGTPPPSDLSSISNTVDNGARPSLQRHGRSSPTRLMRVSPAPGCRPYTQKPPPEQQQRRAEKTTLLCREITSRWKTTRMARARDSRKKTGGDDLVQKEMARNAAKDVWDHKLRDKHIFHYTSHHSVRSIPFLRNAGVEFCDADTIAVIGQSI
ncbi:unnamed protein product [Zymoseptoria tritici ST99CH_1A5]|uniref:Uncharacterized protein n=1 Tax=Zymoseptoria tritici ST99CH_1A5 TaxID=1276529 RepID=A0A1Y6M0M0_ZYMTR|nr:unnamed protein product [Zymoseptoria tritici ST99CH_1A5]